jgi:hypothetical protein
VDFGQDAENPGRTQSKEVFRRTTPGQAANKGLALAVRGPQVSGFYFSFVIPN